MLGNRHAVPRRARQYRELIRGVSFNTCEDYVRKIRRFQTPTWANADNCTNGTISCPTIAMHDRELLHQMFLAIRLIQRQACTIAAAYRERTKRAKRGRESFLDRVASTSVEEPLCLAVRGFTCSIRDCKRSTTNSGTRVLWCKFVISSGIKSLAAKHTAP